MMLNSKKKNEDFKFWEFYSVLVCVMLTSDICLNNSFSCGDIITDLLEVEDAVFLWRGGLFLMYLCNRYTIATMMPTKRIDPKMAPMTIPAIWPARLLLL